MAELGTLVTVVTADTSGFTANMGKAELAAKQFGKEVPKQMNDAIGGVKALEEKLHGAFSTLRGFREVIGLGLGVGVGRQIFEKVHEGIVHLVEGFNEGTAAGENFSDSLADGIKNMLGMKTHAEELAESNKKLTDTFEALAKSREKHEETLHPKEQEFPYVSGAEADLKAAKEARDKAYEGLAEPSKELANIAKRRDELQKMFDAAGGGTQADRERSFGPLDEERNKVMAEHGTAFAAARAADSHYEEVQKDLEEKNRNERMLQGGNEENAKRSKAVEDAMRKDERLRAKEAQEKLEQRQRDFEEHRANGSAGF